MYVVLIEKVLCRTKNTLMSHKNFGIIIDKPEALAFEVEAERVE